MRRCLFVSLGLVTACSSSGTTSAGAGGAGGAGSGAGGAIAPSSAASSSGGGEATSSAVSSGSGGGAPVMLPAMQNLGTGFQIYAGGGYRYGPSILVHPDQSIDMFTCSPGTGGAWDYIRHRRSTDGGHTWTDDGVALQPTPGSRDAYSCCDPGAVMIGGKYYLGYTSTENVKGTENQVYLARAAAPEGPYEKWNGTGWGGNPQPIVTYKGDPNAYGAGEPSLVVVGKKIFVYSTNVDGIGGYTDCATADDVTADDWPAKLVPHGHVITRRVAAEDSTDVKFDDALQRFIGVATYDRFGVDATVGVYQSIDGLAFEPIAFRGARVQAGAHNMGLSGDESGHLGATTPAFIAYAYAPVGSSWGNWPTYVDPITFTTVAPGTPVGGGVSSNLPGAAGWDWSGPKLWDGDATTLYSSDAHGAVAAAPEQVLIDLGKPYPVKGLVVTPRGGGLGFPTAFTLQAGLDLAQLTDVPGQSYTGYPAPMSDATFSFGAPVMARYVRLAVTALGTDDGGGHYLQLAEIHAIVE